MATHTFSSRSLATWGRNRLSKYEALENLNPTDRNETRFQLVDARSRNETNRPGNNIGMRLFFGV